MPRGISRREVLGIGGRAAVGMMVSHSVYSGISDGSSAKVRIGVIGTGNRGRGLLGILVTLPDVEVPALCDISVENLGKAQRIVEASGRPKPEGYSRDEEAFRDLVSREDLDAVIIATPWHWHTPMAVASMEAGKYAGVEVPAAISYDQCWELVKVHERTGVPCMMLENWSFRRDNLAVLRMIREGLFGEVVHCHCAHSHDCVDHWFFDTDGNMRWGGEYLVKYNRDQYPTHSLGPVLSWMDINCGDAFATVTSTASASKGINAFFARKYGPDHPNAKIEYNQGDIVTSVIRTHLGKTIVVNYDMQLPRPYDNRWMIQGTLGVYDEARSSIYLAGRSPQYHQWEPFPPYQAEYEHPWWREIHEVAEQKGHGGTDYLELLRFLDAVRLKSQTPIDVYDSVTMSSLVPMSEESIAKGSTPVECPDFTGGKWKSRKASFALV